VALGVPLGAETLTSEPRPKQRPKTAENDSRAYLVVTDKENARLNVGRAFAITLSIQLRTG
jgi:hypothetical protein